MSTDSSEPIVIVAALTVKPEALEMALAAFEEAIITTHAEDDGCLRYSLHQSVDDPQRLVFIEHWGSPEALERHLGTPHVRRLGAALRDVLAEPPDMVKTRALPFGDTVKGAI